MTAYLLQLVIAAFAGIVQANHLAHIPLRDLVEVFSFIKENYEPRMTISAFSRPLNYCDNVTIDCMCQEEPPADHPCPTSKPRDCSSFTTNDENCEPTNMTMDGYSKFVYFTCRKTFIQAQDFCRSSGWELATPNNQFEEFCQALPTRNDEFWVDVAPTHPDDPTTEPLIWFWQTLPPVLVTEEQWKFGFFNTTYAAKNKNCASLKQEDGLFAFNCGRLSFFACECDPNL